MTSSTGDKDSFVEEEKDDIDEADESSTAPSTRMDSMMSSSTPPLSRLMGLAYKERFMILFAFFLMTASEGLTLYNPILLAGAYNYLIDPTITDNGERMSLISFVMIRVIVIHLSSVVLTYCRTAILQCAGERVVARLRNDLYAAILRQEIAFFDEHKTGELVSRLGSDTTLIQQATTSSAPECLLGIIKLLVAISLMIWISAPLAGVTVGTVVVVFLLCLPFGKLLGKLSKSYQDVLGHAQTFSTEALGGMRTVQSFCAEWKEQKRYERVIGNPDDFKFWWPYKEKDKTSLQDCGSSAASLPRSNRKGAEKQPSSEGAKSYVPNTTTYRVGFFKSLVQSALTTIVFGLGFGSLYICLWYGFKLVVDGALSFGSLTAFQSYIFSIGASLGQTTMFISQIIQAQGASGRIFYLLDRTPAIPSGPKKDGDEDNGGEDFGASNLGENQKEGGMTIRDEEGGVKSIVSPNPWLKPKEMVGLVEFRNVDFSYPSRPNAPVLKNFNLTISANTTAAIVGTSGAGKSTVIALLQRFYDVSSGSITIDGHDIRELDVKWLRSRIGYVQQEPVLFGISCRDNVTYGIGIEDSDRDSPLHKSEVTEEELNQVCQKANCHHFIKSWPEGYDTLVGERGVKLSGGQKQRIAIARALLIDPRILILDEASSSLDAESEHLVQKAINQAVVGRTVLIVAHRLSTIQNADQIVVMGNHGEICDVGTHSQLLTRCSRYQSLIKRQSMVTTGALNLTPEELADIERE